MNDEKISAQTRNPKATDLVCVMNADPDRATATEVRDDTTYYFCCKSPGRRDQRRPALTQAQVGIAMGTGTGAHDMQIYERTLSPGGLFIKFKRLRDEKPLQVANGILKRVK